MKSILCRNNCDAKIFYAGLRMLNALYPQRPWTADALLLPPWGGAGSPQTTPTWRLDVIQGRLLPVGALDPQWSLEWNPVSPVFITPHGLVEADRGQSNQPAFCAYCPEAGILVGECDAKQRPHLLPIVGSINELPDGEEFETPHHLARLRIIKRGKRVFFILAILQDQAADSSCLLAQYESCDPLASLREALSPYQPFAQRQASLQPEDTDRLQTALFSLISGLRSSRDGSRLFGVPDPAAAGRFETRHIYELVKAWCEVRIDVAGALMRTLLDHEQPDGSVPGSLDEHGVPAGGTLYLPILAHCFRLTWRLAADREWFDYAAPRIQRHVEYVIQSLDPERTGLPQWPSADDALAPDLYQDNLVSADLPALLAREISALEDIANSVAVRSLDLADLLQYRDLLLTRMRESLWSPEAGGFSERYTDGRPIIRQTISAVMPLLCRELTPTEISVLTNQLLSRQHLLADNGVQAWVPWADEMQAPPVWPIHQMLLLEALEMRGATAEIAAVRAALLAQLPEDNDAASIALLIQLLAVPADNQFNNRIISPALLWMNQHRRAVISTAASFFLLFNASVFFYSCRKTTLTPQTIETTAGLARRYYQEQNYQGAEELLARIIASGQPYPSAYVDMGNIQYRLGHWEEAEACYRHPSDVPAIQAQALHNLAVLLKERGRTNEAAAAWKKVRDDFNIVAPGTAARAVTALKLLDADNVK